MDPFAGLIDGSTAPIESRTTQVKEPPPPEELPPPPEQAPLAELPELPDYAGTNVDLTA